MFAAIVKVISLKCVQHKTKPQKTTTWKIKKVKTPLFHVTSCSKSITFKYNFLKRWIYKKIKIKSTPRSCNQKKSSVYKSSKSSSSLIIGINIGSGIKLNANIIPLTICEKIIKKVKKPKSECISWKLTDKIEKYFTKFKIFKLK